MLPRRQNLGSAPCKTHQRSISLLGWRNTPRNLVLSPRGPEGRDSSSLRSWMCSTCRGFPGVQRCGWAGTLPPPPPPPLRQHYLFFKQLGNCLKEKSKRGKTHSSETASLPGTGLQDHPALLLTPCLKSTLKIKHFSISGNTKSKEKSSAFFSQRTKCTFGFLTLLFQRFFFPVLLSHVEGMKKCWGGWWLRTV